VIATSVDALSVVESSASGSLAKKSMSSIWSQSCQVWTVLCLLQNLPSVAIEPLFGRLGCADCYIVMEGDDTLVEPSVHLSSDIFTHSSVLQQGAALIVSPLGMKSTNRIPLASKTSVAVILHTVLAVLKLFVRGELSSSPA
jgi:hypothetical protein